MLAIEYLKYLARAKSRYGIHAPFMYKFSTEILPSSKQKVNTDDVEVLRKELLQNKNKISVLDLGAGSKYNNQNKKRVCEITRRAAKSKKLASLLCRMVEEFNPGTMLELGSSLGISTAYQAKAAPGAKFITLEGCPQTAEIAIQNLQKLNCQNVELRVGDFNDTIDKALSDLGKLDWFFVDGNHQKEATLSYFQKALPYANDFSVFIFDDIYWSKGMKDAWTQIKNHDTVVSSIDLFWFGIVLFRPGLNKEHFTLRF
ncbi:MAG: class I SAM-dependent methyltransferase [Bacteroidia bacterium]|nr:class I SAM-dependent methyltransferase [Bacteroidia bacterium]